MPESVGSGQAASVPDSAASVVGAVRTETAARDVDLAAIRYRVEDGAHYVDCDRFEVYDYGCRQGRCDCKAAEDLPALLALVDELTAQRDLARDAAVALEQENARLSERLRPPRDDGIGGATHPMADPYKRAEPSPAAVLGLGLQPETSEQ